MAARQPNQIPIKVGTRIMSRKWDDEHLGQVMLLLLSIVAVSVMQGARCRPTSHSTSTASGNWERPLKRRDARMVKEYQNTRGTARRRKISRGEARRGKENLPEPTENLFRAISHSWFQSLNPQQNSSLCYLCCLLFQIPPPNHVSSSQIANRNSTRRYK